MTSTNGTLMDDGDLDHDGEQHPLHRPSYKWPPMIRTAAVATVAIVVLLLSGLLWVPRGNNHYNGNAPNLVSYWIPYNGVYYKYFLFMDSRHTNYIVFENISMNDDGSSEKGWGEGDWSTYYESSNDDATSFSYEYHSQKRILTIDGTDYSVRKNSLFLVSIGSKQVTQIFTDLSSLSTESIDSVTQFATSNADVVQFWSQM